jgi:hypothetical protein
MTTHVSLRDRLQAKHVSKLLERNGLGSFLDVLFRPTVETQRVLVPEPGVELLQWLESDGSKARFFALHVLARRQLDTRTLEEIRALRDDVQERPWVKMAALRCLMEIQRERRVREEETKKQDFLSRPPNLASPNGGPA